MKKSSILILIIICLCGCGKSSKKTSITGEIKGLGTDTLYLYGMDESFDRIDTIFANGDKFSYTTSIDTITSVYLLIDNQIEYPIFLDKGNQIKIKGNIDHLEFLDINGNKYNEEFTAFQKELGSLPSDEEVNVLMNSLDNSHVIMDTTAEQVYTLNETGRPHVAFIDMGAKQGIIRDLLKRGCKITVFPANIPASVIEEANPDLVFLSNGPGDPLDAPGTVDTVKQLIGKYPICGICMGHQIIGLALGCETKKLKFGHHGGNHPVKDLTTGNVFITSQNHNYIVADLPDTVEETFINVNDGTCEGIRHKTLPIQSVQFHPEASPGPLDTGWLFDRFLKGVN